LIRDAVECINALVTGNDIQPAVVADLDDTTTDTDTTEF
jgi:hypothetical protein